MPHRAENPEELLLGHLDQLVLATDTPAGGDEQLAFLTAGVLADDANNGHEETAADSARGDLTNDRAEVETGRRGGTGGTAAEQRSNDLRTYSAANHTGNCVPDRAKIKLLQQVSGDVATSCSRQ
jgi:hypothetical protein